MVKIKRVLAFFAVVSLMLFSSHGLSETNVDVSQASATETAYKVNPGDILEINVWKEEGMVQEVLVRPDGGISFPLVGDLIVQNLTLSQIEKAVTEKLGQYLSDPVVTVLAKQLLGNKIYVIGQVNKPGEYVVNSYVDVMQVLSMAGGMTPFAAENSILILRRQNNGQQQAIEFEYGELEDGDELQQNIMMKAGDVVVVP